MQNQSAPYPKGFFPNRNRFFAGHSQAAKAPALFLLCHLPRRVNLRQDYLYAHLPEPALQLLKGQNAPKSFR